MGLRHCDCEDTRTATEIQYGAVMRRVFTSKTECSDSSGMISETEDVFGIDQNIGHRLIIIIIESLLAPGRNYAKCGVHHDGRGKITPCICDVSKNSKFFNHDLGESRAYVSR